MNLDDLKGQTTIDVETAGKVLSISKNAAYRAVKRGEIPHLRIGQRIVVPVPKLLEMLGVEVESVEVEVPVPEGTPLRVVSGTDDRNG